MRVTNFMTHNHSLNNIHRNMRHLQRLYEQTTSTKVISRPSQDPLIASRSLRFRTRLAGVEQHLMNVESGHAWMNVTESAIFNLVRGEDSLHSRILDEVTRALNDPNPQSAKLVMMTNLENLKRQIGLEMNQTMGGRFVFSGWRTGEPPVLNRPQRDGDYPVYHVITQTFNIRDIEETRFFQRLNPTDMPNHGTVTILKLPYRHNPNVPSAGMGPTLSFTASHTLPGTVLPIPNAPPLGIFESDGVTPLTVIDSGGIPIPVDILPRTMADPDVFVPGPAGHEIFYVAETGELILGEYVAAQFHDGIQIRYQVSNLQEGDLNPWVYFDTWSSVPRVDSSVPGHTPPAPPPFNHHWPMMPQPIYYQFSHGSPVQVNAEARNVFTAQMYADLRRMVDFARSLTPPDRREIEYYYRHTHNKEGHELNFAVDKRISDENNIIRYGMHNRLNNLLRLLNTQHTLDATREHTKLGNRMSRVEMFEIRLEQDEGNYTRLMSENEDVDMTWAIIQQSIAEAAFQGALRVIANNVQLSLVHFV